MQLFKYFSLLFLSISISLNAVVTKLTQEQVNQIKPHLVEFHPTTGSSGNNPPKLSNVDKNNRVFVAKMDSFGIDRYWFFEDDSDIASLVNAVRQGGGMSNSWYFLQDPWKYDSLITIESF